MGLLILLAIMFVIVVIHEAGHLIVAKMNGVGVTTFSVGFGPRLIGFKFYQNKVTKKLRIAYKILNYKSNNPALWASTYSTEYRIAPIPFGGFCAMEGEIVGVGDSRELASKSLVQKTAVAVAGAFMNILTGVGVIIAIATKHFGFIEGLKKTAYIVTYAIVESYKNICLLFSGQAEILGPKETSVVLGMLTTEQILLMFGVLSVIMALVNLLPFPALDGSLPFLFTLKKLFGEQTGDKIIKYLWVGGFILLMALQVWIFIWWLFQ